MRQRLAIFWMMALVLLGNLLGPALVSACLPATMPARSCAMASPKASAMVSDGSAHSCCCGGANAGVDSLNSPSAGPECVCRMESAPDHDTSPVIAAPPDSLAFAVLPAMKPFANAPARELRNVIAVSSRRVTTTLPRGPDCGRAPPVS